MKSRTRTAIITATVLVFFTTACVCGPQEQGAIKKTGTIRIGLSMDTLKEERWQRDKDLVEKRAKELGMQVNVQVANGSDTNVYINANGKYEVLSTTDAAGNSRVFSLKHVGGASVDAVVQKIVTRAHFPLSQLHYLVIDGDPISHHLNWLVYPVRGTPVEYFETSGPHGHLLQLLKNSPAGPTPVR